jgi:hypothetical protein
MATLVDIVVDGGHEVARTVAGIPPLRLRLG